MLIFLLKRTHSQYWQAGEARGFVVIAASAAIARIRAAEQCGDEGAEIWHDPHLSTCELIGAAALAAIYPAGQEAHVVLRGYYGD